MKSIGHTAIVCIGLQNRGVNETYDAETKKQCIF